MTSLVLPTRKALLSLLLVFSMLLSLLSPVFAEEVTMPEEAPPAAAAEEILLDEAPEVELLLDEEAEDAVLPEEAEEEVFLSEEAPGEAAEEVSQPVKAPGDAISVQEYNCAFAETSLFVPENGKLTPVLNGKLPEGAYFTSSSKANVAVSSTTGVLTGKALGSSVISLCVKDASGAVTTLSTVNAYCFRPTGFSIKKNGTASYDPDPYRILTLTNSTSKYTNRTYPLFRQQFDKANDYQNYAWLGYHGCAAVAAADIAQGYGIKYATPIWLFEEGIPAVAAKCGVSASTLASKMPAGAGTGGSPLGWTGIQEVLKYVGIPSRLGTWTKANPAPAVEAITKSLSEGRPIILIVHDNKWTNPRTGATLALGSTYHYILLTGIDADGYVLNSCSSSANVQTNNALNGYEVKITVAELVENFINTSKPRTKTDDFFYSVSGGSGSMVYLEVTSDHANGGSSLTMTSPAPTPSTPAPVSIKGKEVTLSKTSYTYTGEECRPVVTVKGLTGADYTVSYSDNVEAGTATVTITGIGSYTGTIKQTFTIKPASIKGMTLTLSQKSFAYTGKACKPAVTIDGLTEDDFTVSYSKNTKVGTATVTATGVGSYKDSLSATFSIKKATPTITAVDKAVTVKSKAQTIKLGAKSSAGLKLTYKSSNSKKVKVSSKGVVTVAKNFIGNATITISSAANDSYKAASLKITVTARPKCPTLSSVTSSKKSTVVVKWKKASVSGYQVQYSYRPSFKTTKEVDVSGKSTSTTLDWLHDDVTCYFRIRCYKKVSGEKIWSDWTDYKTVHIK